VSFYVGADGSVLVVAKRVVAFPLLKIICVAHNLTDTDFVQIGDGSG